MSESNGNLLARQVKRRYKTVTLADGEKIRLRSLLRSEQRTWKNQTRDKTAEQYSDDVLLAMCIVDDEGNQRIATQTALEGFFDTWDMAECQILLRAALELNYPPVAEVSLEAAIKN